MAYRCITEGMDELSRSLDSLGNAAQGAASAGLYEAAGVYADAVSAGVQGISTEPFKYATGGRKRKPSPEEKAILQGAGSAGIARFKKNGVHVDTSVGFNNAGYATVKWNHMKSGRRTNYKYNRESQRVTQQYGRNKGGENAKPVPVIANAINSGTSFMEKQPFFRKAVSKAKGKARDAFESKAMSFLDNVSTGTGYKSSK